MLVETPGHVDGSPGRHYWYKTEEEFTRKVIGEGASAVDFRGAKHYSLGAGSPLSCHATGRPYKILQGAPAKVPLLSSSDHESFLSAARKITGGQKLTDYLPEETHEPPNGSSGSGGKGPRPGDAYNEKADWGDILLPHGWEFVGAQGELQRWRRPGKDQGHSATTGIHSKGGTELFHCFSANAPPFTARGNYSKFETYAELNHGGDYSLAARALGKEDYGGPRKRAPECPSQNGKLLVGFEPLPAFEPFPLDVLPELVSTFIIGYAKAIGCDPAMVALPTLVTMGGLVGNARRIQLKKSWTEPCVFWGAVIARSGTVKSPALEAPLKTVQLENCQRIDEHKNQIETYNLEREAYEIDKKSRLKKGRIDDGARRRPEPPTCERLLVSDTTIETLIPILHESPKGVLVYRDELDGWFSSFGEYKNKKGSDRAHWLSLHRGGTLVLDRKSTDQHISIHGACASVLGSIQPGVLKRALTGEHRDSGLAATLLWAMPPKLPRRWSEADVDDELQSRFEGLLAGLWWAGLDPDQ